MSPSKNVGYTIKQMPRHRYYYFSVIQMGDNPEVLQVEGGT